MTRFENVPIGSRVTGSTSFLLVQAIFEPILKPIHSSYLSAYEDGTECSETSSYKIQTPGHYPEESTQHSEHGESLKSRMNSAVTRRNAKLGAEARHIRSYK
jgi:hypothetical protein